jgi:hypothetical protein
MSETSLPCVVEVKLGRFWVAGRSCMTCLALAQNVMGGSSRLLNRAFQDLGAPQH